MWEAGIVGGTDAASKRGIRSIARRVSTLAQVYLLAELVTNSYDHAFPHNEGLVTLSVRAPAQNDGGLATLTVSDTGTGFVPVYESKRQGVGLVRRLIR